MRVRLPASYDIRSYSAPVQVLLTALKTYGLILADIGSSWYVSGAPDARWDDSDMSNIGKVLGSDFEVVQMGTIITS